MNTTIKYTIILSIIFTVTAFSADAQSKNEQIQILTGKIDSLTTVSKQENLKFTALENELKTTINDFKTTVNELKATIQNKNEVVKNLTIDLANLKKSAAKKIDSLQAIHTSLKNQPKGDFNFITVNYANLVNGYKVKAAWRPILVNTELYGRGGLITGPAILQFSNAKDSVLFSVNTDYFTLNKDLFSITYVDQDSVDIASLNTTKITIQNKAQAQIDPSNPLAFENEFGFADVDFNGDKELIVKSGFGQRSVSTYEVYGIGEDGISRLSYTPFTEIDDETEFNYAAKTITIAALDGYCGSQYTTYTKHNNGGFIPTMLVKMDVDTAGNCIQSTYKITKNLQLLKKVVLKN